jgi:hypothetical protein
MPVDGVIGAMLADLNDCSSIALRESTDAAIAATLLA